MACFLWNIEPDRLVRMKFKTYKTVVSNTHGPWATRNKNIICVKIDGIFRRKICT